MAVKESLVLFFFVFARLLSAVPEKCLLPFPRTYVAYSLKEHELIDIDGKLDEDAWKNVAWTEDFIGKRSFLSCSFKPSYSGGRIYIFPHSFIICFHSLYI